jgi:ribosomal protein S18 acetylase RimI-like enzyme
MIDKFKIIKSPPSATDYLRLRKAVGMSKRNHKGAAIAMQNSWFGVQLVADKQVVAMGRIVGDGGCSFLITDIVVLPEYQGNGLGTKVMKNLMDYYHAHAPQESYLVLLADGKAKFLYQKFGFQFSAPDSVGMIYKKA